MVILIHKNNNKQNLKNKVKRKWMIVNHRKCVLRIEYHRFLLRVFISSNRHYVHNDSMQITSATYKICTLRFSYFHMFTTILYGESELEF